MHNDGHTVDANVSHAIFVERLGAQNANKLDPELRKLASYVRSRIGEEGELITTKKAMNALIKDIRARFGSTYGDWVTETFRSIDGLAAYERDFQADILQADVTSKVSKPTQAATVAAVYAVPMMIGANGAAVSVRALVGNFSKTQTDIVTDLIVAGQSQGRSVSTIIASITGTKKNGFSDGVMIGTKRSATTISKTAYNHTSTQAKQAVYDDNEKAVIGYKIVAVLDGKTSQICRGLDGTEVKFKDSFQPHPPFHRHCRTTEAPLLNPSLARISTEARSNDMPKGSEFQSTASQYYTRMKSQPAWYQDDVLGKTQGKIFRNAGLTPEEFRRATITKTGEPLNLKQMAEKDSRIKSYLESIK